MSTPTTSNLDYTRQLRFDAPPERIVDALTTLEGLAGPSSGAVEVTVPLEPLASDGEDRGHRAEALAIARAYVDRDNRHATAAALSGAVSWIWRSRTILPSATVKCSTTRSVPSRSTSMS